MSHKDDTIRAAVRQRYGGIAAPQVASTGCCGGEAASTGCCGGEQAASSCCCGHAPTVDERALQMGYSPEELASIPQGANMALSCGNPHAVAALKPGEVVLDLGSGGGFDVFLAANQLGETGQVIGVDMTAEMIALARENARKGGYRQVEFRLGEIEHLPVADGTVDVILSNCVVNLSPDKLAVFREAFRVLKPGGRLAISDTIALTELPAEIRNDLDLHCECVSGAETVDVLRALLVEAGFTDIRIRPKDESRAVIHEWVPGCSVDEYVVAGLIEAIRP